MGAFSKAIGAFIPLCRSIRIRVYTAVRDKNESNIIDEGFSPKDV
jgi:hypothetical protein